MQATYFTALPTECLECILQYLDFLSAFSLSLVSKRLRQDSLRLWKNTHKVPYSVNDLGSHGTATEFSQAAHKAIADSALHTSSPCFRYSSVIPHPLPLSHAAAALDIASMYSVLSGSCSFHNSTTQATSKAVKRGRYGHELNSEPAKKISPLQIAVLCQSNRVVQALISERSGYLDPMLTNNPHGVHDRIDLDVYKLPNAHLGSFAEFDTRGRRIGTHKSKIVSVRIYKPTATKLIPYDEEDSRKPCINTTFLLEVACLIHNPDIFASLCHGTTMKAPDYSLSRLLSPTSSVCVASHVRYGLECYANDYFNNPGKREWASQSNALPSDRLKHIKSDRSDAMLFCEHLDKCPYIHGLSQIVRAMIDTGRLSAVVSQKALNCLADFGDKNLIQAFLRSRPDYAAFEAAIIRRIQWRMLYSPIKLHKIALSSRESCEEKILCQAIFCKCVRGNRAPVHVSNFREASESDIDTRLQTFFMVFFRRQREVLEFLSRSNRFCTT